MFEPIISNERIAANNNRFFWECYSCEIPKAEYYLRNGVAQCYRDAAFWDAYFTGHLTVAKWLVSLYPDEYKLVETRRKCVAFIRGTQIYDEELHTEIVQKINKIRI